MCFSASASFTAAAVLVPIGIYGTHIARTTDQKAYAPLAMTPAFFGTQQFIEGLQWTAIDNGGLEPLGSITARGFLFFAYCFPYTFTMLSHFLRGLNYVHKDSEIYKESVLCKSLSGVDVPLITISSRMKSDPKNYN